MKNFDDLLIERKSIIILDLMFNHNSTYIYKNETKAYIENHILVIKRSHLLYKLFPVLFSKIESILYPMNITKVTFNLIYYYYIILVQLLLFIGLSNN